MAAIRLDMLQPAALELLLGQSLRELGHSDVSQLVGIHALLKTSPLAALASMTLAVLGVSRVPLAVRKSGGSHTRSLDSLLYLIP